MPHPLMEKYLANHERYMEREQKRVVSRFSHLPAEDETEKAMLLQMSSDSARSTAYWNMARDAQEGSKIALEKLNDAELATEFQILENEYESMSKLVDAEYHRELAALLKWRKTHGREVWTEKILWILRYHSS